jgi:hypothetical protein
MKKVTTMQKHDTLSTMLWVITVTLAVILTPTREAYAYLDPGTGSFLLQILLAGFLGLMLTLRLFRERIAAIFKALLRRKPTETAEEPHSKIIGED